MADKKRIDDIIQQIHQSFEQLKDTFTKNSSLSPDSSLYKLADICFDLTKGTYAIPDEAIDIFEYILKHYIELFDSNQLIDMIARRCAWANNRLLHALFSCFNKLHDSEQWSSNSLLSKTQLQIHHRLLDCFVLSKNFMSFLEHQFPFQSIDDEIIQRTITNSYESVIIIILTHIKKLHLRSQGNELDKYQNTLFKPLLTFLDKNFTTNKYSSDETLIRTILNFLCIISDRTITITMFINADYPQVCLQWLTCPHRHPWEYLYIVAILYNIARHDNGALVLRKHEYGTIVQRFRTKISNTMVTFILNDEVYQELVFTHSITLILVYDVNEINSDTTERFITNGLLPAIVSIVNSSDELYLGFESSEIWFILMRLCMYELLFYRILLNKKYPHILSIVLKQFVHYQQIAINGKFYSHNLNLTILANILWSISFRDIYCDDLQDSTEIVKSLEILRSVGIIDQVVPNMYKSRYMSSLQRSIDGLWYNLHPSKIQIESPKIKSVYSIMISYSPMDIHFCQQIYDLLNQFSQLSISVDFIEKKYLWKETAQMIEQSDLVLFLISNEFSISRSCRQEFIHAATTLKKRLITVYIDDKYQANEWLKNQVTVRFKPTDFTGACDELLLMISRNLSIDISVKNTSDVKQWNSKDVQQWFIENNIASELHDFYQFQNGKELLSFARNVLAFPWMKEYDRIKLRLEEKFNQNEQRVSSAEFSKFITVLEGLQNKT